MSATANNTRTHVVESDYAGLRLLGTRLGVAVDHWTALDAFLCRELGADTASLLAEPEALGNGRYDWYASIDGPAVAFRSLSAADQRRLLASAEAKLEPLRQLANEAIADGRSRERRDFGEMLRSALTVPAERLEKSLYQVGDEPVLVNWGARLDRPDAAAGPLVIALPPLRKPIESKRLPWEVPLWVLFALISSAIFVELVEGCTLFNRLGLGPNYCDVEMSADANLMALLEESEDLESQLSLLTKASIEAPLCAYGVPPHVDSNKIKAIGPPKRTQRPNTPSGSINQTALHQTLNDRIRQAGGGSCPGVEVVASWQVPVDVDLRLYCQLDERGDTARDDQIVDAYNPEACDARWDIGSSGQEAEDPFVERICITQPDGSGQERYLATVYREDEGPGAVPVTLYARSGDLIDQISVDVEPKSETQEGLPVTIDGGT